MMQSLINFCKGSVALLLLVVVAAWSQNVLGQDLFPVGAENKARGMESVVSSQRGSAVFYNPSNLTLSATRRLYVDVGVVAVSYSYEHPSYDPVIIDTKSPIVSAAYTGYLRDKWFFGLAMTPLKGGSMEVPGVPRDVGGQFFPVAVKTDDLALRSGLAFAYKHSNSLRFGVTFNHLYEKKGLEANVVGNSDTVLKYNVYSQVIVPRVGLTFRRNRFAAAVAVRPAIKRSYTGSYESVSSPDVFKSPISSYIPTNFALGGSLRLGKFNLQTDLSYYGWAAGKDNINSGQSAAAGVSDLKNVWNLGISAKFRTGRNLNLTLGVAKLPSPWGEGGTASESSGLSLRGTDFGTLEGIDRISYGFGGEMSWSKKLRCDFAFMRSTGERTVSAEGSNLGIYQIAITTLSSTLSYDF
jgi:hypothetical protein